jgi:thiamine-monophosphate kinase
VSDDTAPVALGAGREFDLIRAMLARWGPRARGIGGDCAIVDPPAGTRLVVSTDTSVEDVHFRRDWLSPSAIGYRATVAALSDLAAAAASPLGVLVALTLPPAWIDAAGALAEGIGEAVAHADTVVLGGDTTGGSALSLTVTVLGAAVRPLSRAGARPGDHLYVTGRFGGPAAAVRAWREGRAVSAAWLDRFARPVPRLAEARWLAAHGAVAAVDISDGCVADVGHLAAASRVRITIHLDRVPRVDGVSRADVAGGGEEYELAVIAPRGLDVDAFARAFALPLTDVGEVAAGADGACGVDPFDGDARVDPAGGWDHFSE